MGGVRGGSWRRGHLQDGRSVDTSKERSDEVSHECSASICVRGRCADRAGDGRESRRKGTTSCSNPVFFCHYWDSPQRLTPPQSRDRSSSYPLLRSFSTFERIREGSCPTQSSPPPSCSVSSCSQRAPSLLSWMILTAGKPSIASLGPISDPQT